MPGNILIIEDDDSMRELIQMELEDEGYHTEALDSGFAGLKALQNQAFDLVVLDIRMPGMDGIEALERIINSQRGLPVIIHSAYSHFKENYRTWSAAAYVVKSMDLGELKNTIKQNLKTTTT